MGKLFPKGERHSDTYKYWVKQYGVQQVEEIWDQCDEMEEWIPEMDTEQLLMYVGCFHTFDELPQSQAYIQKHFPDLLENKFQFQVLSTMAHNELKQNRGYRFKDRMINEFYEIMGLNTQNDAEDSGFPNDNKSDNSDTEWDSLPWYKKVYYAFLGICLIYWVCRGLYWLFTVIF